MNQIATIDQNWRLAADEYNWVLLRRCDLIGWKIAEFVCTSKARLARRMRRHGIPDEATRLVIDGLPATPQPAALIRPMVKLELAWAAEAAE